MVSYLTGNPRNCSRFRTYSSFVLLALALLTCSTRAHAAEFTFLGEKDEVFHVSLKGPITKGDSKRLANAVQPAFAKDDVLPWARAIRLHLDSPGGNLKAGLDVIEFILENYIATEVDKGARCYSACSLIFMSGNGVTRNFVETYVNRQLHIDGKLGFHAPYVNFEGVGYNAAIKQLGRILRLLDNKGTLLTGKPFLKQSLMVELLLRGPDDNFLIDTVDKAGRWDIALTGIAQPKKLALKNFKIACDNVISWQKDRYSSGIIASELEGKVSKVACSEWQQCKSKYVTELKMAGTQVSGIVNDTGCIIEFAPGNTFPLQVKTWQDAPPTDKNVIGDLGNVWWMYKGDTPLSKINTPR